LKLIFDVDHYHAIRPLDWAPTKIRYSHWNCTNILFLMECLTISGFRHHLIFLHADPGWHFCIPGLQLPIHKKVHTTKTYMFLVDVVVVELSCATFSDHI